jgi:uncharacterized protein (TIGR02284 family)
MNQQEKLMGMLNDLIRVNNDRITGYEKAAMDANAYSVDLKNLFHHMAAESRKHVRTLSTIVIEQNGHPEGGTSAASKWHNLWKDLRAGLTGENANSILTYCQDIEIAVQKTYKEALDRFVDLPISLEKIISLQQISLKNALDLINSRRENKSLQ